MILNKIFITVGTTKFDELIKEISTEKIAKILQEFNCKKLTLQIGHGKTYNLANLSYYNFTEIEEYSLKNVITSDIDSADLVISHAGAGSCIETLRAKKRLVVVINERLMDNHQVELAKELSDQGFLVYCTIDKLADTLATLNENQFREYKQGNIKLFVDQLDKFMRFK